jgi:sigma-E factor negative regulatory protein RseA
MTEKLSALLDGHLDDDAAAHSVFDDLRRDQVMREKWGAYCLIGDALRGEAPVARDLTSRVLARLEAEPTVLAPARRVGAVARSTRLGRVVLPVAASVMGVTAVGWVVQSMEPRSGPLEVAAKVAGKGAGMVAAAAPAALPDDPLRSYVFAHQALSGGSPIPGVAQYVRTVTEVRQGADR